MTTLLAALVALHGARPGLGLPAAAGGAPALGGYAVVQGLVDEVAEHMSRRFNCTISLALKSSRGVAAGAFSRGRPSDVHSEYAYGSATKLITGASVMKLVSEGRLRLDDQVAPIVDPFITRMANHNKLIPFRSLADIWGLRSKSMTIRHLLSMTAGFPDFDTAQPCDPGDASCIPLDPLRYSLFKHPSHDFAPSELLNKPWVKGNWTECGKFDKNQRFCYSSTNFILLGMVLAQKSGASTWQELDQLAFLPEKYKDQIRFVKHGTPRQNGLAPGFDRTIYNMPEGQTQNRSVHDVAGVFSGWTGSNAVGAALPLARLTYDIYSPESEMLPRLRVKQMLPRPGHWYGIATFNIGSGGLGTVGQGGKYGRAYGHFGATYGYQSAVAYFPKLDFSIAVLSDIETMTQDQTGMALCFLYNAIAGYMLDMRITCRGVTGNYYGPSCTMCQQIKRKRERGGRQSR